jgi:hypothetical protein
MLNLAKLVFQMRIISSFLVAFFVLGADSPNLTENNLILLKSTFEKNFRASRHLLTLEIISQLEQILYCEDSTRSIPLNHADSEGNPDLDLFKIYIMGLKTVIKSPKQYIALLELFWSAFGYINFVMYEYKRIYAKEHPECTLNNLIELQASYPLQIYCYSFTYYSLLYIIYFQFTCKDSTIAATPHKFAFAELPSQLFIINSQFQNNSHKEKKARLATKTILQFLKEFISFQYQYESQIAHLIKPNKVSNEYAGNVLTEYLRNTDSIDRYLRSIV